MLSVMNISSSVNARKKAVWGPKRTLAAVLLAVFAVAPNAMAEGRHVRHMPHAKPGVPGLKVKNYKIDEELTRRAARGITIGSRTVHDTLGYTGAGVGIAVIDSGIATWHDDLTNKSSKIFPYGNQRVAKFVDFVNGRTQPYDDAGHGTHVSGILLGNGYDSLGQMEGVAPGASLVSLKVLDQNGQGTIGNIIAAMNW